MSDREHQEVSREERHYEDGRAPLAAEVCFTHGGQSHRLTEWLVPFSPLEKH